MRYSSEGHLVKIFVDKSAKPNYEPTYQLVSSSTIDFDQIKTIIRKSIEFNIESPEGMSRYNRDKVTRFTQMVAGDIQERLRLQFFNRYRYITVVNVIEKRYQQVEWTMNFTWDSGTDQWTVYKHETNTFIVCVLVSFVYKE